MTLCITLFLLCHFPPTDLACYLQRVLLMQQWNWEKENVKTQLSYALGRNTMLFL